MPARPRSIRYFEVAYLLALVMIYLNVYLDWDRTVAQVEATPGYEGRGLGYMIWTLAFWTPVNFAFWYLAAYRRSMAAKWLIVGMVLVNAFDIATPVLFTGLGRTEAFLQLAFFVPSLLAVWFLFRPDAKRWFDERSEKYPDIFS